MNYVDTIRPHPPTFSRKTKVKKGVLVAHKIARRKKDSEVKREKYGRTELMADHRQTRLKNQLLGFKMTYLVVDFWSMKTSGVIWMLSLVGLSGLWGRRSDRFSLAFLLSLVAKKGITTLVLALTAMTLSLFLSIFFLFYSLQLSRPLRALWRISFLRSLRSFEAQIGSPW